MYPPDHYHGMTDEQLAQWHQLTTKVTLLENQLRLKDADFLAAVGNAIELQTQAATERRRLADEVLSLTQQLTDQKNANRRLCGEQVQLVRALRALVDVVKLIGPSNVPDRFLAALDKKVIEAVEVLALVEVPFG